jgi:hypothetical protein
MWNPLDFSDDPRGAVHRTPWQKILEPQERVEQVDLTYDCRRNLLKTLQLLI